MSIVMPYLFPIDPQPALHSHRTYRKNNHPAVPALRHRNPLLIPSAAGQERQRSIRRTLNPGRIGQMRQILRIDLIIPAAEYRIPEPIDIIVPIGRYRHRHLIGKAFRQFLRGILHGIGKVPFSVQTDLLSDSIHL